MADRLPTETIELVLSLVFEPPGAEDVDVKRERERRAMLHGAAVVCRRWRPAAMAMLPMSIVLRSTDELAAHASAVEGGTLDGARVHSLTVARFEMAPSDAARLHALATAMPYLYFLRLACAATIQHCGRRWPGRHMVVDKVVRVNEGGRIEWSDRVVYAILGASSGIVHLSILTPGNFWDKGSALLGHEFSLRVETLRLGSETDTFFTDAEWGLLGDVGMPEMPRLASLHMFVKNVDHAGAFIVSDHKAQRVPGRHQALRSVVMRLVKAPCATYVPEDARGAITLLNRLPATCARLACELVNVNSATMSAATALLWIWTDALRRASDVCVKTLILDVRLCGVGEAWRSSAEVVGLEAACGAKGVALELRI